MKNKVSLVVLGVILFIVTISISEIMQYNSTLGYVIATLAIFIIIYKFILFE